MVSVTTSEETTSAAPHSAADDAVFLLHESAPQRLHAAFGRDPTAAWAAWRKHLRKRKWPSLRKLLKTKNHPLAWSAGARRDTDDLRPAAFALGAIKDAHDLPDAAERDDWPKWWARLSSLLEGAKAAETDGAPIGSLAGQLWRGELPLTLAWLFPELEVCQQLAQGALATLTAGMKELLGDDGVLSACAWADWRPLLACWTRCCAMANQLGIGESNSPSDRCFGRFVRETVRFSRCDGSAVLSDDGADADYADLFQAAARSTRDNALKRFVRGFGRGKLSSRSLSKRAAPPAVHSERAQAAQLRTTWSMRGERLSVLYADHRVRLELESGGRVLLSGEWRLDVQFDGIVAPPEGDWEEVCWVSDDDGDYLELETPLGFGRAIQRQMFLSRNDRTLLLADALLLPEPADIAYRSAVSLPRAVQFAPADETREGLLRADGKSRALLLPLALPEWRSDPRGGMLTATADAVELNQSARGKTLFAPLWFDLEPKRFKRSSTWRQLTVAENRENQPRDVAVGYRVQAARRQWLIYRSFRQPSNRTVLGHNLSTQFLVGRFTPGEEVKTLIEIE